MKKLVKVGAVVAVLGVGLYFYGPSLSPSHKSATWVRSEPVKTCSEKGCNFVYTLCVPSLPVGNCDARQFNLSESYGADTSFMPYPTRDHAFTTPEELRSEADARADIIENIHR